MKPKFLLDEHVNPAIKYQLIRRNIEIEILCVGDEGVPPRGTLDPEILFWIEQNGFILVTANRSTMPVHLIDHLAAGRRYPGIFLIKKKAKLGQIVQTLELIWEASKAEEYYDKTSFIPL